MTVIINLNFITQLLPLNYLQNIRVATTLKSILLLFLTR